MRSLRQVINTILSQTEIITLSQSQISWTFPSIITVRHLNLRLLQISSMRSSEVWLHTMPTSTSTLCTTHGRKSPWLCYKYCAYPCPESQDEVTTCAHWIPTAVKTRRITAWYCGGQISSKHPENYLTEGHFDEWILEALCLTQLHLSIPFLPLYLPFLSLGPGCQTRC